MLEILAKYPEKKFNNKILGQVELYEGTLVWLSNMEEVIMSNTVLKMEWEEVKEPVDFMTALRSGKKVMIKHHDLDGELNYMTETYNDINDVMYNISNYFTAEGVREIFLNGEWYIED